MFEKIRKYTKVMLIMSFAGAVSMSSLSSVHAQEVSIPELPKQADPNLKKNIVGVWELVSYKVQDKESGKLIDAMGAHPRGRVISRLTVGLRLILKGVIVSRQKMTQIARIS